MKKTARWLLAGLLAGLVLSATGCGGAGEQDSLVYLEYGTGILEDGNYNTELYGINIKEPQGGDPHVIWVSEEEDPVNGGWYYMYSGGVGSAPEYQQEHISVLAVICYRSRDLYQWERCGALDGFCVGIDDEDWCQMHQWGAVRDPQSGGWEILLLLLRGCGTGLRGGGDFQLILRLGQAVSCRFGIGFSHGTL